jgi:hypothetical protein
MRFKLLTRSCSEVGSSVYSIEPLLFRSNRNLRYRLGCHPFKAFALVALYFLHRLLPVRGEHGARRSAPCG